MDIKQEIQALEKDLIQLRREIHMHPELGLQEFQTSGLVEQYLKELGIHTKRVFNTGIVGIIEGKRPGKTILLRADLDALPVEEENDLPFKSQNKGVMHACGHDAHTAMLLVAAKILCAHRDKLCGTVKLVFEPNEEEAGAQKMIAEGVLTNPDVDASFALHVNNFLDVGTVGLNSGAMWAETDNFKITLKGKGGHTSEPHKAIDPIICASAIIQTAQVIQTREISPLDTTVIMFGSVHSGTTHNVIPETAELLGTLRYLYDGDDDAPQRPRKRLERIVQTVAETYHIEADIQFDVSSYVLINDHNFVNFLSESVIDKAIGKSNILPVVTLAGEDFCEFMNRSGIPGAMVFLGAGSEELGSLGALHSPRFQIDESCLKIGVELHVRTALEFLSKSK